MYYNTEKYPIILVYIFVLYDFFFTLSYKVPFSVSNMKNSIKFFYKGGSMNLFNVNPKIHTSIFGHEGAWDYP